MITEPTGGRNRSASPQPAAISTMMTPIPMNKAVLSDVPNVEIAHSRTDVGEWSTTVEPTAKYGDASGEIGTATNSPTASPAATATTPDNAAQAERTGVEPKFVTPSLIPAFRGG